MMVLSFSWSNKGFYIW